MSALKSFVLLILISGIAFNANAQFAKAEVSVSGMTCSMCQLAVEKALKTIDFISDIKPDLNKNTYVLSFKKGIPVNPALIRKKIENAGFSVSKLIATFNFNKLPVSNNFRFSYDGNFYRFMNVEDKVLDGNVKLVLISNGFLSSSDFKKYAAQTSDASYKTGTSGSEKVFYVTLAGNY